MEKIELAFAAGQPAACRALAGVVGSGDLEVLLEPNAAGSTAVAITTSVDGMATFWQAVLQRIFGAGDLPASRIEINDFGATPGVVRLRIEQALETVAGGSGERRQDEH